MARAFNQAQFRSLLCGEDGVHRSSAMKKFLIGLVLASLAATPALAKTKYQRQSSDPEAVGMSAAHQSGYGAYQSGYGAYAAVGDASRYGPGSVIFGNYVGWDPDPNIRYQLFREYPFLEGNGQ
jgi:opacity protein-like surface antigen